MKKARYAAPRDGAHTLMTFLEQRAARTEQLRQPPPETLHDLHETGLFRLLQPEALGGEARLPRAHLLTRACASTAWNLTNLASHHRMLDAGESPVHPEECAQDF
jgi:3-hydroxy-9,10-secoandrosta-1,3,5(10)-triene-9,17-dione monooxygenase